MFRNQSGGGDSQTQRRSTTAGIPTVIDRLIQQALAQKLSELFDRTFSNSSYGFRRGEAHSKQWNRRVNTSTADTGMS
jgi:hypothetical protein